MCAWRVWGNPYSTSEATNTIIFQPVVFNDDYILRASRTWIVVYNDPTFTSLNMKIYSNSSANAPKKLLATSTNVQLKADIHTEDNAIKEIWFEFDYFPVQANETYNFVLNASGYTGSDTSHLAWMKGFPDPILTVPGGLSYTSKSKAPFQLYFIGSEL